jgi:elongation factor G
MFSDDMTELLLEEQPVPEELIHTTIRRATISQQMTPVMMGSAYKNKGVQALLNAVGHWLPDPTEVVNEALDTLNDEKKVIVDSSLDKPLLALAFKLEDGRYGQLTYLRVYQGILKKGDFIYNVRSRDKLKVGRLVRMHSNEMQDIDSACAGDIVALFGVDCYSGDTFSDGKSWLSMTSMHIPNAVISIAIKPSDSMSQGNMSKALQRFNKEDPTFHVRTDEETGETIISGMGELHLEVYIERMRREYKVNVDTSPPRVSYRESITKRADYNYTHKKQTGGSGQYGRVAGFMEPLEGGEEVYEFVDKIKGGVIPREFIPACNKGFRSMITEGRLIGAPVVGVRMTINDGAYHAVDSSDRAFQAAARGAWRDVYHRAGPIVLEPVMKVSVEAPTEFQGSIIGTINQRRGSILGMQESDGYATIDSEVPLAEMFGYATVLRSATQGKAEFTMEFARYSPAPKSVTEALIKAYVEEKANR